MVSALAIKESDTEDLKLILLYCLIVVAAMSTITGLFVVLAKLVSLDMQILHLQQESLKKYKHMFDAIQESIVVVTDDEISYMNT